MEKKPFLTLQQVQEITKTYPTPFHIYDEKAIRENARKVKKAFAWNPGYKEYFAVKATPNPRLIQILHEEGFGCDCSSLPELQLSDVCGVKEHDIMFSSNVTPAEDYKLASDLNAIINFDDITHLDFYDKVVGDWKETMSCRFNPGGDFVLNNSIMDTPQEAKYGMTREQLVEAFKYMKQKVLSISAFTHSSPPTRLPMSTIRHWHASCSSWRLTCRRRPACISHSSTCPAA